MRLLAVFPVFLMSLAALLPASAPAIAQSLGNLRLQAFAQTLVLPAPFARNPGSGPDWQAGDTGTLIAEWVPAGQQVERWSEMITVTAVQGVAAAGPVEAVLQAAVDRLSRLYHRGCARPVQMQAMTALTLPGTRDVRPVVLQCPQVQGASFGEGMAVLAIAGRQDVYTVQWAERFPADPSGGLPVPMATWNTRLQTLSGLRLCDAGQTCD